MIRPIETKYKGYRFRSRLEARWAVFFEAMGWQWEYEPEGFDLGAAGYYLPDFKMWGVDSNGDNNTFWFEIKRSGASLSDSEQAKINAFANWCLEDGPTEGYGMFIVLDGMPDEIVYLSPNSDHVWAMDIVYREGRPTFEMEGDRTLDERRTRYKKMAQLYGNERLSHAQSPIEKARAARFEHGEAPC